MNLTAYQRVGQALFVRSASNKEKAKKIILNHNMLSATDYVVFKNKNYTIGQVYKW